MGSFEISGEKLAITFRDSCEFYAHSETGTTLVGRKDRRPDHLGNGADCRVIAWPDNQPKVPLQGRRFRKADERTDRTYIFNLTLNLSLRRKYTNGPGDHRSPVSTSFFNGRHVGWFLRSVLSKLYIRPSRSGNETYIAGAGFDGSSIPQALGNDQRIEPSPRCCGWPAGYRIVEKMIVKLGRDSRHMQLTRILSKI